jgi:predicted transcriptional regulator
MSTKEVLLEVAEKLPPDATLVDAIYELEFRQAVEDGLASLDRGERIPLDEARKRIPQWTSKSSSPPTPWSTWSGSLSTSDSMMLQPARGWETNCSIPRFP